MEIRIPINYNFYQSEENLSLTHTHRGYFQSHKIVCNNIQYNITVGKENFSPEMAMWYKCLYAGLALES